MELLYFISGVLSVGVLYGIKLLRSVKSSHTDLLAKHQAQSNISSIRSGEFDEKIRDLDILVRDIQMNMEKDQYESLTELNKKNEELSKSIDKLQSDLKESNRVFNKNVVDAFNRINQLNQNLNKLGQDPNLVSKY